MKPIFQAMGLTVVVALALTVVAGQTSAEEKKIPSPDDLLKALAKAGQPGPEHKKLQPCVGDWTFTLKVWTCPDKSPAEVKGTVERKWIMGGRFVQETARGTHGRNSVEGRG